MSNDLDYIGPDELVFHNDKELGIHSGGFSVNSILWNAGMSPIMTLNSPDTQFGGGKVSDLFQDLVVPNWVLSYNNRISGGAKYRGRDEDSSSDSEDEIIHDDLHDRLLEMVKAHNTAVKRKGTRRVKSAPKSRTTTRHRK